MKAEAYQIIRTTFRMEDREVADAYERMAKERGTFRKREDDVGFIEIGEWAWTIIEL